MDVVRRYAGLATKVRLWANVTEKVLTCLLDRDQIDQALGELLENAIHHTPAHGEIRVTAAPVALPAGMRVRITVQDTGPGVPNEDKERIFEPFFSKRPGGSGLGLAIVRQIVENHRGTIRETGGANQGARFEIELPAHTKQEMSP